MKRENNNLTRVKSLIFSVFLMVLAGCTPKSTESVAPQSKKNEIAASQLQVKPPDFSKTLREAIYFSSSLEREALKLILKNRSLQKHSLFSVLSYIVEVNTGAKKTTPYGLDCGKFEVKREANTITIFKSCVKPATEVVRINILQEDSLYDVKFMTREWSSVVGWAVGLTGSDVRCQMKIKDKKLNRLSCENWSYQVGESQTSSTVVKAREFLFEREALKQFVIKGGFFKELVENKKIDIVVPLEGKIKIIEKEIKVIDEFAEKLKQESEKKNEESKEISKEIKNEGVSEEGVKDTGEEGVKDISQESNQENQDAAESVSQDPTPEESNCGRRGR